MNAVRSIAMFAVSLACLAESPAAIFPQSRGAWPQDWPKELEAFRKTSRTIGVGTGIQENIYEIPMADREAFEKIWPVILKLRTPGSPFTLYKAGSAPPKGWDRFLSNEKAAIRIYGPTGAYSLLDEIDPKNPPNFQELLGTGQALQAKAPWPAYLVGKGGELPEYVSGTRVDGKLQWVVVDPNDKNKQAKGFYIRARIDVELVVDGKIVDLNRIKLPGEGRIVDRRFDE